MKKNGFISSALLYGILSLFIVLMLSSLAILGNRKIAIDKIKTSAIDDVSHSNHLYVASYGNDEEGNGTLDRPYATVTKAYNEAAMESTIFIMTNITQTSTITLNQNKIITLKSYGNKTNSIIRGSGFTSNIVNITSGSLNLQNIVFDGNNVSAQGSLIGVSGEGVTLTTNTGTTLKNNNNGFIYQNDSTNLDKLGGAISIDDKATATINNTQITGNTGDYGGGIYHNSEKVLNISGSTINSNTSRHAGGAVYSNFGINTSSSTINSNKAPNGGGLFIHTISTNPTTTNASIENTTISGNTATISGGGITGSKVNLTIKNGTTINNNSGGSLGYDNNIDIKSYDKFIDDHSGYESSASSKRIVTAVNNSFSIEVQSGTIANDTNIQLYTNNTTTQQKWSVYPYKVENGVVTYVFVSQLNATPRQCLWIAGNSSTAGANVITFQFHGNAGGYWTLENMGSSYYRVKNIGGLCLELLNGTAANNTNIRANTCNTTNAQKWKFIAV